MRSPVLDECREGRHMVVSPDVRGVHLTTDRTQPADCSERGWVAFTLCRPDDSVEAVCHGRRVTCRECLAVVAAEEVHGE